MFEGINLSPLKKIYHPQGDIYHVLKSTDNDFTEFGEAYFSTIKSNKIKGWKKHTQMTMNLVVPVGSIKFVIYDDRDNSKSNGLFYEAIISADNYHRLTVPPGVWMGFQGRGDNFNLLLNIANITHNPLESKSKPLDYINYNWSL
jgi:dTDP-4-dehydrorhamnose 3,5-epimerase